jgi:hypothetical protein
MMKQISIEWVPCDNPRFDKTLTEAGAVLMFVGYFDFDAQTYELHQLRFNNIDGRLYRQNIHTKNWQTPRYPSDAEIKRQLADQLARIR